MQKIKNILQELRKEKIIVYLILLFVSLISITSTFYYYSKDFILLYGDAESHINISKRVISGLTTGFGQLGGVWLPLQHVMMIPFVWNDTLWRNGIGGAMVSMICFIISSVFIYKIIYLLTNNKLAALTGLFIFSTNPNVLYLQSTPLGETPLMVMMTIAIYYLAKWAIYDDFINLVIGAFFIFCGSLIRYDAWFLIFCSLLVIPLIGLIKRYKLAKIESSVILYSAISFLGILFWLIWNYLILKNPLYFLLSPYSAKTQQLGWLKQGQLPSYHNMISSLSFYTLDSIKNVGLIFFILAIAGIIFCIIDAFRNRKNFAKYAALFLITTPYLFYVVTLFFGISIILLPDLVPAHFQSRLFNARYGIMVLPAVAVFIGLLSKRLNSLGKLVLYILIILQLFLFITGGNPIVIEDGINGLSGRKPNPSNIYLRSHYDYGFLIFDDFARTVNPVSLNIPMNKIIYVGNHPYWEQSLVHPTKYARWIVIRHDKNDTLWKNLKNNNEFLTNYHVVFVNGSTYVYKRNSRN